MRTIKIREGQTLLDLAKASNEGLLAAQKLVDGQAHIRHILQDLSSGQEITLDHEANIQNTGDYIHEASQDFVGSDFQTSEFK